MMMSPSPVSSISLSQSSDYSWPVPVWNVTTPEEQEMDSDILQDMVDYFEENHISINSVIVTRNGHIVLEQYFDFFDENTSMNIFSCTKTLTSTLVGIAIDHGFIENTSVRVLDFFPDRENL